MTTAEQQWRRLHQDKPDPGYRISIRSAGYTGEAHAFDERLRTWDPVTGYGPDLILDDVTEWMPVLENGLPSRFSVD
jgi:hypothetical protein